MTDWIEELATDELVRASVAYNSMDGGALDSSMNELSSMRHNTCRAVLKSRGQLCPCPNKECTKDRDKAIRANCGSERESSVPEIDAGGIVKGS